MAWNALHAEVENMYKETIKNAGNKMDKTIANIQNDLATLRAGRANPKILDKITVDYYGTPTALNQVGNISSPEPRLLVIAPWEPKMIGPIEKAIQKSDIGINPSNDGKVIRLLVPELTGERRKDLCKQVKKMVEEGKVAIRNIRRDAMESIKKMKKDSAITEDDQKLAEKELQKVTDAHIEELEKVGADKEKEIMSV
jgi:ribosome recycling factor